MLRMSIEDYEKLVDKIISGKATPQEVSMFAVSTPILPILSKMGILKNKAIVDVIVTDERGNPVPDVEVLLNGETKVTDESGKAEFEFSNTVPPGFVLLRKGTITNKVPFTGCLIGQKILVAGILSERAESPVAFGEDLKKIIDTAYQWRLIKDIESKALAPELANFPQIGVLKRKSDYEYEVYLPCPVEIKVPKFVFKPSVAVPGGPEIPIPSAPKPPTPPSIPQPTPVKGYDVVITVTPSRKVDIPPNSINVSVVAVPIPTFATTAMGEWGKYTFHNVPNGDYKAILTTPFGVQVKEFKVANAPVSISFKVNVPEMHPPSPPQPPVTPPAPPSVPKPPSAGVTFTATGFIAKCPYAVMEVNKVGRCWNWVNKHTYYPFSTLTGYPVWYVKSISGKLNGGPSELNRYITVYVDVMEAGSNKWSRIGEVKVMADEHTKTSYHFNVNKSITQIRFVAENGHYVDYSEVEVVGHPAEAIPPKPPIPAPPVTPPKPPAPPTPPTPPQPKTATIKVAVLPFFGSTPKPYPLPRELVGGEYSVDSSKLISPSPSSTSKYILPKVTVYVDGKSKSGSYGTYTFANLEPGKHTVKVVANGRVFTKTVEVNPGETKIINYSIPVMIRPPTPPPTPKPPTPTPPHVTPKPPAPPTPTPPKPPVTHPPQPIIKPPTPTPPVTPPKPPTPPTPPTPPPECKEGETKVLREGNWEIVKKCVNGKWVVVRKEPILLKPPTPTLPKPPVTHPPQPISPKPPVAPVKPPETGPVLISKPPVSPTKPPYPVKPSPGQLPLKEPIKPSGTVVKVLPPKGATFSFELQALTEVTVYVDGKSKSGSYGTYTFANLEPGKHTVKVVANGKVIYDKVIEVAPGEKKEVSVEVPVTILKGAIAVDIRRGSYAPSTPNITITVDGKSKRATSYGRVEFADLEPKSYTVTIKDNQTGKAITKRVTVVPNKTAVISYEVEGKAPTSTIVVNVEGRPNLPIGRYER